MTEQEAFEYLISINISLARGNGKIRLSDAIKKATEALLKQIPKKPNTETINRGIDISGEYDIESNYICPNCKNVVGEVEFEEHYYDFCPDCGQAFDWSDENDKRNIR